MEPFPNIEEFDLVIIALNTLTQQIFDRILRKPAEIAGEINTIFRTGRLAWCIIEEQLSRSPPKTGPKALPPGFTMPSNYDWLPFPATNLVHKVKPGSTVQIVESIAADTLRPYLEKVDKWDLEIEVIDSGSADTGLRLAPIATNKSGKMISAAIVGSGRPPNSITLLPKPTKCNTHEAIEVLIDIATGKDRLEPRWRDQIEIPGISAIDTEISKHEEGVLAVQKQINELKAKRLNLERYRDVFSVHEHAQVEAVKKILKEMGIETERTQPAFVIDLQGKEAAIEVTSTTGKIDSSSKKMFQLTQFIDKHHKNEKMVLVANTYKRDDPKTRIGKEDFTSAVIEFLKLNEVCAMTSSTLLELWKKEKPTAKNTIMQTSGELRAS
jgi:hypothetical protein